MSLEPPTLQDRFRGALLGLACGDALGTTLEFSPRDRGAVLTTIVGGGPFNLQRGQWTDDTSMALCLAESLIHCQGFDPQDQLERYVRWYRDGHLSSTGECFDIGATTRESLDRFIATGALTGSADLRASGNGSLMRLAPVALVWHFNAASAVEMAARSSATTHASVLAVDACRYYASRIVMALDGASKQAITAGLDQVVHPWANSPLVEPISEIAQGWYKTKSRDQITGSGYVVESLEAALWCFVNTDSFAQACLAAANLGDDADTTAATVGQLAGAFYGVDAIPQDWLSVVALRDTIIGMADGLLALSTALEATLPSTRPPHTAPPYSYGSRDVQPGYESPGSADPEPWGRDPWTDS